MTHLNLIRQVGFVNAYQTEQCWGGPEEGGWFFERGEPLACVPVLTTFQADEAREYLKETFEGMRPSEWRMTGDPFDDGPDGPDLLYFEGDVSVVFEEHPAESYPKARPFYE